MSLLNKGYHLQCTLMWVDLSVQHKEILAMLRFSCLTYKSLQALLKVILLNHNLQLFQNLLTQVRVTALNVK